MEDQKRLPDTDTNRLIEYVEKAVEQFIAQVEKILKTSDDSENASSSNVVGQVGTVVDGISSTATGIPLPVGKVGGKVARVLGQKREHKQAKKLAKCFEGFNKPEQKVKWIHSLVDIFSDIFICYNLQFNHLTKDLRDPWTKAMVN